MGKMNYAAILRKYSEAVIECEDADDDISTLGELFETMGDGAETSAAEEFEAYASEVDSDDEAEVALTAYVDAFSDVELDNFSIDDDSECSIVLNGEELFSGTLSEMLERY